MGIGIKITNTDVLKNKAILVKLSRKKFNHNKTDKLLSQEYAKMKNVTEDGMVRVNKTILPKSVMKDIGDVYNKAGKYFYRVTLPWDDKGYRLLSIDLYKDFTTTFKGHTNKYRGFVEMFIENILNHVEESKAILGDAWSADDYKFLSPNGAVDRQMLSDQFELEIEFGTITDGDDLRACLTEEDREAVAAKINEQCMKKFAKSQEHIITTLQEHVFAIHERLCKDENVFRDTLIENLLDLVDLIPKMNIANDPAINQLAAEAKAKLGKWEPQELRDDPKKRKEVADEAGKILDNMKGII